MLQTIDLRLGSRDHPRIAVAYTDGDYAAEEIEVLFAIHIPDVLHEAVIHGNRLGEIVGDRRKDEFLLLAIDLFVRQVRFLGWDCRRGHVCLVGLRNHDKPGDWWLAASSLGKFPRH